ncbi:MAG TPA: aldo/keto reductase [Thermoflexales bacterium]|nr:aldo/keto reductase [Thermoflexales bacterium]HQW35669.1 aldo/keto reductase [Thermoflexales bacterium]HQZ23530.1 aldo/keto reductase [Thermoflexales bacterium]HRA00934.1 aldo/keto reductase [Thermoflexales bacterium]
MELRKLGNSSLMVSPLCLGGNVFGWTIDERRSFEVLDAFLAHGGNFVDSADVYSRWKEGNTGGESETIVGAWMKARGNRGKVILATKCGSDMGDGKKGLSAKWIARAVEDSLRRLQTDYIDLYQAHIDDAATPLEETLAAFDALVKAGKVRAIGASNYTGARLQAALDISKANGLARYESLQPKYNAIDREIEADQLPICQKNNVGVIPYYALAAGFLTGKYRPGQQLPDTARAGGVQKNYMNERGFAVLEKVERLAKENNATPSQVALAWLMRRPGITAPIASATSAAQVAEMFGAFGISNIEL